MHRIEETLEKYHGHELKLYCAFQKARVYPALARQNILGRQSADRPEPVVAPWRKAHPAKPQAQPTVFSSLLAFGDQYFSLYIKVQTD